MDLLRNTADRIGDIIGEDPSCQSLNDFLMLGLKLVEFCEIDEFDVDVSLQERLNLALELFCFTKIQAIKTGSDKDLVRASLLVSRAMRLQGNIEEAFNELKNLLELDELDYESKEDIKKELLAFNEPHVVDEETRNSRFCDGIAFNTAQSSINLNEGKFRLIKRRIIFDSKVGKEIRKKV